MSKDEKTLAPVEKAPIAVLHFEAGVDQSYADMLGRALQAGITAGANVSMKGPKALLENGKTVSSRASFPAEALGEYLGTANTASEVKFLTPFQIGLAFTSPSGQKGTLKLGA